MYNRRQGSIFSYSHEESDKYSRNFFTFKQRYTLSLCDLLGSGFHQWTWHMEIHISESNQFPLCAQSTRILRGKLQKIRSGFRKCYAYGDLIVSRTRIHLLKRDICSKEEQPYSTLSLPEAVFESSSFPCMPIALRRRSRNTISLFSKKSTFMSTKSLCAAIPLGSEKESVYSS